MADVFISYSRKDTDFVRRLHDAVADAKRQAWVDWEGIPLTAKFLNEIYAAIEAADTFIFVISPDSVASHYCLLELAHAAELNKRLVPVVRRDAPADQVPDSLAELNWIFCRESDDFAATFQTLLTALDTNLPYVKAHTRLLTRAIEWERRDQNGSLLLRGQDLRQAEELLAGAGPETKPAPVALQRQYALASRRAETRGQRTRLGAVSVALVVAVVLGLLAWGQRNQAVSQRSEAAAQRDRAEEQARVAGSRELALAAQSQFGPDPERGVLLAVEAARLAPTVEAVAVLRRALVGSHLRMSLDTGGHGVFRAIYNPDGSRILTAEQGGVLRLWDANTGREVKQFVGHKGDVFSAVLSRDGSFVLSGGNDGTVRLWEVNGDRMIIAGQGLGEFVRVAVSPDGSTGAVGLNDTRVLVWPLAGDASKPLTLAGHTGPVTGVAFSMDGRRIVTSSTDGTARIWDSRDGAAITVLTNDVRPVAGVQDATFSPGSALIATASSDGARIWDLATGTARLLSGHTNTVNSVSFSPDGSRLLTASSDRSARLWRVDTGEAIAEFTGHGFAVTWAAFSPDGQRIVTASGDRTARVWLAVATDALPEVKDETQRQRYLLGAAPVSPDGALVVASDPGSPDIVLKQRSDRRTLQTFSGHPQFPFSAAFSADGARLVSAGMGSTAGVWDVRSGAPLAVLTGHSASVTSTDFSPDGRWVLTGSFDKSVRLWDVATGRLVRALGSHEGSVLSVRFSADGTLVMSLGADYMVRVWDVASGATVGEPRVHQAPVNQAVFSPDGSLIASASDDGSARVWETRTGRSVAELHEPNGSMRSVAFSPDGAFVVTVERAATTTDGFLRVWAVNGGSQLAASATGPLTRDATFSADGRHIATGFSPTPTRCTSAKSA